MKQKRNAIADESDEVKCVLLHSFNYITIPVKTDNVKMDVTNLFIQNGKNATLSHGINVAKLNAEIAEQFGLDKNKCILSGLLHDISAIVKPDDMLKYAIDNNFEICDAERKFPFLLHQRISRVIACEYFKFIDIDILSAIECHTTLKATPNKYEMALFIADKLSWDQNSIPPFYDEVKSALNESLEKACYVYMCFMINNEKVLYPHTNWTLGYESIKKTINTKIESRCGEAACKLNL